MDIQSVDERNERQHSRLLVGSCGYGEIKLFLKKIFKNQTTMLW
jgi:hypothetical protein